jgi:hypothetical protein
MISTDTDIINSLKNIDPNVLNGIVHERSDFVHRFFQYPAMMVPLSQEAVVGIISKFLPKDARMMDPFMGSSTSLIIGMEYGFNCFGQDINPLAILISKVKTGLLDNEKFLRGYNLIARQIKEDSSNYIEVDFPNIDKWFTTNVQIELSKIKRSIIKVRDLEVRRFFWVILAETVRITSNDRTSTYKLHQRSLKDLKKRNHSPIDEFSKMSIRSINDIKLFRKKLEEKKLLKDNRYVNNIRICWGDTLKSINTNLKYNLLVSSPPYGDNHTTVTYGQHAYLPLQWIPLKDIDENLNHDFLRTTQEIDRISLGGTIDKQVIKQREFLFNKTNTLCDFYYSFDEFSRKKVNKSIAFFYDFDVTLNNIIEKLEKNAFLIWTIGNRHVAKKELRNDLILTELLENKGINLISEVEREILFKRMPSRNNISNTMSKEKILVFRKPY